MPSRRRTRSRCSRAPSSLRRRRGRCRRPRNVPPIVTLPLRVAAAGGRRSSGRLRIDSAPSATRTSNSCSSLLTRHVCGKCRRAFFTGAASLTDCLSLTSSFRSQAKLAASEGEVPVRPVVCRCTPHPLLGGVARSFGTRGVVDRNVAAIPTSDMTATVPLLLQVGAVLISQTGEVIATGR